MVVCLSLIRNGCELGFLNTASCLLCCMFGRHFMSNEYLLKVHE